MNDTVNSADVVTVTMSTKITDKNLTGETKLTVDFSTIARADLIALALKQIKIDVQKEYREAGEIPATDSVNAHDYRPGQPRGPRKAPTAESLLAKLPPDEARKLLESMLAKLGG